MPDKKRLFFGFEIFAPWPLKMPSGKIIDPIHRHLTVAFLGECNYAHVQQLLKNIPLPDFKVGMVGILDHLVFLPRKHPHVVSYYPQLENPEPLIQYQGKLVEFLRANQCQIEDKREFLPHISVCRSPFSEREWRKAFERLPFFMGHLNLYESLGHSTYNSLWSHKLFFPFEEYEHTADIAFKIRGENLFAIFKHALWALAFKHPSLIQYENLQNFETLDDVIRGLNQIVGEEDAKRGCPFKAISYHGELVRDSNEILEWEMIVDV